LRASRVDAAKGSWREAIASADQIIANVPSPDALALLADAHAALGQDEEAASFRIALEGIAQRKNGQMHRSWALSLLDAGSHADTIVVLAAADTLVRRDVHTLDLLAWALHRSNRSAEALPIMRRAMKLGGREPAMRYHAGLIELAAGNREAARGHLEIALRGRHALTPLQVVEARKRVRGCEALTLWTSRRSSRLVSLGFGHITAPGALDHILFLVALAAIYRWNEWRQALVVITAFTVGHSITLAVAVLRPGSLPDPGIVEFLIPLTILATGVENIFTRGVVERRIHAGRRAMLAECSAWCTAPDSPATSRNCSPARSLHRCSDSTSASSSARPWSSRLRLRSWASSIAACGVVVRYPYESAVVRIQAACRLGVVRRVRHGRTLGC
jgi:hypothetical protein